MSKRSTVYRVFISSTVEDLEPYRSAAKEAVLAADMLPVMCEYFAASSHNPPLKECLERVKETDLLIVLTAHRYGWIPQQASGKSKPKKPRKSITWLECEQAVQNQNEVLGFFIGHDDWPAEMKEPYRVTQGLLDGKLDQDMVANVQESVDGLKAFQSWLNNRGIRKKIATPSELQIQVVLALKEWQSRQPDRAVADTVTPATATPEKYLNQLNEQCAYIDIRGLAVGSGKAHRFPIEDLYIALQSRQSVREANPPTKTKRTDRSSESQQGEWLEKSGEVPLQRALSERRLVVIGDPGAGKTTFLRRVAGALCLTELGTQRQAAQSRLGLRDKTFPIFLRCAKLANHISAHLKQLVKQPGTPTDPVSPAWIAHCLAADSRENGTGLDQAYFQRQLEAGRCTVMLDGLDEAPDLAERANLSTLAETASQTYSACRFVVTSRPPAYTGTAVLPQFAHVEIAPLSDEAVEQFLKHWCGQLYGENPAAATNHNRELLEALHARPEIRRVARNPVMLTALAVVHWNERRLPEQRAELYKSVITWLSRSRENRPDREKPERTVTLLQELALAMHNHPEGRRTQVSKRWGAEHVLATHFGPSPPTTQSIAAAEKFLTEEELDSGIVVAVGNDIRFWHLQFQEYLAARAIAGQPETGQHEILFGKNSKLYLPEWREVILLLGGALLEQGEAKVGWFVKTVLDTLAASATPSKTGTKGRKKSTHPSLADEARCAGLLGAVFHDLRPTGYDPTEPRYHELLSRVMAIFDRDRSASVDIPTRIAAAEALGQVGDPRFELDAKSRWITIPAGRFHRGAQKTDPSGLNFDPEAEEEIESPVHEVTLDSFQIARFPLTVGEYQRFVEHDGYLSKKFWNGGGFGRFTEPEDWEDQLPFKNRPVVGVSWYEAAAFCQWGGFRLPTEAEWERAARGDTGRKYPWGPEPADETRLNFNGNIGRPTPVGIYPLGGTPDGIEEMAGNVWEWCQDWYGPYAAGEQVNPCGPEEAEYRVLRGGSWGSSSRVARSAIRGRHAPVNRLNYLGFRVVCCVRTS